MPRQYEYHHVVTLEETNLTGNVYFTHYLRWQGRCREMFLHDHARDVLGELGERLTLVTKRCSCDYLDELAAFDEMTIRLHLVEMRHNIIVLRFDFVRQTAGGEELVARGEQEIACMTRQGGRLAPAPIPAALEEALRWYVPARG